MPRNSSHILCVYSVVISFLLSVNANAQDATAVDAAPKLSLISGTWAADADAGSEAEDYQLHAQTTNVTQYHPRFTSPYRGPNSLDPGNRGNETVDLTLFAGVRLWQGAEFYANPEVDQGFGLSNTLGLAGFSSGEAYKIGAAEPYVRLQRAFLRQTIDLGGETKTIDSDKNQLAGAHTADSLTMTVGKLSVTDIFDNNSYAHDPRADFMNWSIIDAGAFDYAADSWGYSYGAAAEWTQSWWTLRAGVFDLSRIPNDKALERGFGQFEMVAEAEARPDVFGQPGKVKVLVFANRGRMANYTDAVREGALTGTVPDVSKVRRYSTRPGASLNLEQQVAADLGVFLRASYADGQKEAYEFTEIDRSVSAGLSLKGARWNRPDDVVGLAGVVNDLSSAARAYFAAGGLGILIGDGRLPRYGSEEILETYYNAAISKNLMVTFDYQYITDPAYNPQRGPVSVFGGRIHAEF